MMQKFHDNVAQKLLKRQMNIKTTNWVWPRELTDSLLKTPQWYVPSRPEEIILRGIQHKNCVGSYVQWHFEKPNEKLSCKNLLLFTDNFEAELMIHFGIDNNGNKKSIDVNINQIKGKFNKDAPWEARCSLEAIKRKLIGLSANAFIPMPYVENS